LIHFYFSRQNRVERFRVCGAGERIYARENTAICVCVCVFK